MAVVIPCFDDGDFVAEAVASGRDQGAGEVIVVDDGSTDENTRRVLDALEKEGVKVVRQPNSGVSAARMAGVAASEAPYVQPLDADDLLAPGALSRMADLLDADPDLDAVWGDVETFGQRQFVTVTWDGFDPWRLSYLNEIPAAVLLRRSSLVGTSGWDVIGYEDWDLWMTAAEGGWRGARVDQVTLHYRVQAVTRRLDLLHTMDARNRAELRRRHRALYADRRTNCRNSSSRWTVKLVWPLIDRLPFVSELKKNRMLRFSRDLLEPPMRAGATKLRTRVVAAASGQRTRASET